MQYRVLNCLLGGLLVGAVGCSGADEPVIEGTDSETYRLGWNEFQDLVYQEPGHEDGFEIFIVNGDEPILGRKNLRAFYDRLQKIDVQDRVQLPPIDREPLIVNTSGGVDTKWTDTQKLNLTYCVSTGFGSNYTETVAAMSSAASEWEAAANVDFIHVTSQDSNCTASNPNVLFDVRPVNAGGQYLARAFFPDYPRSQRNVLIDGSSFTVSPPLTLVGIIRHELGHVLGFRHEHTRPEAGTCFEDNNWRALTVYDSDSVMHYPQCNGTSDFSLLITALDVAGAQALYGAPGAPPPPPPEGEEVTGTASGSVAQGEEDTFAPLPVVPGTTFDVVMTGSGDPDLYVRFGAAPTTGSWDCRPYIAGANERCTLTVPSGESEAYIMVRGYTSGSYTLTVTYTQPLDGGDPPPPPSGPTEVTENFSGSVARRAEDDYGPLAVVPGTTFTAVMTGNNDADLYVRFGAPPTTSSYSCRPYLNGSSETCSLTVPAGISEAYFMVRGYSRSTSSYNVEVTYTTP